MDKAAYQDLSQRAAQIRAALQARSEACRVRKADEASNAEQEAKAEAERCERMERQARDMREIILAIRQNMDTEKERRQLDVLREREQDELMQILLSTMRQNHEQQMDDVARLFRGKSIRNGSDLCFASLTSLRADNQQVQARLHEALMDFLRYQSDGSSA
ncbi:hypothetical protein FISHEDRAFT_61062 [Fistulina hepatica ATCC 64428]|uniref:Uncharacterized protein n=1 Tax=Fistulina hepatica ATCC 64428 TaxID=1128425 RepID=A0A0D7A4J2_9AGAR|nr:hypothetical protein FISHEDRAFT_61062 [Fistulina hepatica ATCC 64428]